MTHPHCGKTLVEFVWYCLESADPIPKEAGSDNSDKKRKSQET